jgi:hypothetical protein
VDTILDTTSRVLASAPNSSMPSVSFLGVTSRSGHRVIGHSEDKTNRARLDKQLTECASMGQDDVHA